MKKFWKDYLKEQGITFSSYAEEKEYVRQDQLRADRQHQADVLQRGADADTARHRNRVFDEQSSGVARQQNKELNSSRPERPSRPSRSWNDEEHEGSNESTFGAAFARAQAKKEQK